MSEPNLEGPPEGERPAAGAGRLKWNERLDLLAKSPVTFVAMALSVGVWAVAEAHGDTTQVDTLLRFGALTRERVWAGEYWRLATAMVLHIGPAHLFWNLWAGLDPCLRVESRLGSQRYLALYLLSGLAASAVSVIGHNVVSAGASGALFGVVGAELVQEYRRAGTWEAFQGDRKVRRDFWLIVGWFGLGATVLNMDNFAHLGGLAAGTALALAMTVPTVVRRRATVGAVVAVAVTVLLSFGPLPVVHDTQRLIRAVAAAVEKKDHERVMMLTDGLVRDPLADPWLLHVRGYSLLQQMRPQEAAEVAEVLIGRHRDYGPGYAVRGEARFVQGQFEGAASDFSTALKYDAKDLRNLEFLAGAEAELARDNLALDHANAALALAPQDAYALVVRAKVARHLENWDEAAKDCRAATLSDPNAAEAWGELCYVLMKLKDFAEAEAACTRHLALEPHAAASAANRAYARIELNQIEAARADLKAALEFGPADWTRRTDIETVLKGLPSSP